MRAIAAYQRATLRCVRSLAEGCSKGYSPSPGTEPHREVRSLRCNLQFQIPAVLHPCAHSRDAQQGLHVY